MSSLASGFTWVAQTRGSHPVQPMCACSNLLRPKRVFHFVGGPLPITRPQSIEHVTEVPHPPGADVEDHVQQRTLPRVIESLRPRKVCFHHFDGMVHIVFQKEIDFGGYKANVGQVAPDSNGELSGRVLIGTKADAFITAELIK